MVVASGVWTLGRVGAGVKDATGAGAGAEMGAGTVIKLHWVAVPGAVTARTWKHAVSMQV